MIKKIITNLLEVLKLLLKNKAVIVFILSLVGATNAGQYFFIPPHLHYKQPSQAIEKQVIRTTVIKKMDCGLKCKEVMSNIAKKLINKHNHDHNQNEH